MFSGIIEEIGQVSQVQRRGSITRLELEGKEASKGTKVGDSISVNGACLTVIAALNSTLAFEVMPETLQITNLGKLRPGDKVNLERALKVGDRISGHFVLGHVDCTGTISKKYVKSGNLCFEIRYPAKFAHYVIPKGSVAVDGVSLTIAEKKSGTFSVYIIPHTLKNTTLERKGPSSAVNLEFDILAKKNPS